MALEQLTMYQEEGEWHLEVTGQGEKGYLAVVKLGGGEIPVLMSKAVLVVAQLEDGSNLKDVQEMLKRSDEFLTRDEEEPKSIIYKQ